MSITLQTSSATAPRLRAVISPAADIPLMLAPFWVGGLYLALVSALPAWRPAIFFVYLAVLGETHFGATGLFLFVRDNRALLWERRGLLLIAPAIGLVGLLALGAWNIRMALLLGSVASGYHVTRQSIGVLRLYGGRARPWSERMIYAASAGFIGIGFARFFLAALALPPEITAWVQDWLPALSACGAAATGVALLALGQRNRFDRGWTATLTGCLIYAPYCLVALPQDAIAIGVGMHWCQYLALNGAIYRRRALAAGSVLKLLGWGALILLYGVIMAAIHTEGGSVMDTANPLVLLPLCGEVFHYYIDAFIWRFSDPRIRANVGAFIWA